MRRESKSEVIPVPLAAVAADGVAEFCARVSMAPSTFFAMVKSGDIRTVKRGRRTLVPRSEILRFVAALDGEADNVG